MQSVCNMVHFLAYLCLLLEFLCVLCSERSHRSPREGALWKALSDFAESTRACRRLAWEQVTLAYSPPPRVVGDSEVSRKQWRKVALFVAVGAVIRLYEKEKESSPSGNCIFGTLTQLEKDLVNFVSRMWNLKLAAATCCNRKRPNLEVPADAHNNITISEVSEKALATHSSTLARKIPWTEEPGRRQSMGSLRVWHNSTTSLSLFTFMHWRRKWQPTPVFLPGESEGWGSLVGCILWGRTESDTTEAT